MFSPLADCLNMGQKAHHFFYCGKWLVWEPGRESFRRCEAFIKARSA